MKFREIIKENKGVRTIINTWSLKQNAEAIKESISKSNEIVQRFSPNVIRVLFVLMIISIALYKYFLGGN